MVDAHLRPMTRRVDGGGDMYRMDVFELRNAQGPGWFKFLPCTYATYNIYPTLHPRFIVPRTQGIRVFITW